MAEKIYLNVVYATSTYIPYHNDNCAFAAYMGFDGIRFDIAASEFYATLVGGVPQYSTAGVISLLTAAAFNNLEVLFVVYPISSPLSSWTDVYGVPVVGRRPNTEVWAKTLEAQQYMITFVKNYWVTTLGQSLTTISIQYGNEVAWGGAGGPLSTTGGSLDAASNGSLSYRTTYTGGASTTSKQDCANSSLFPAPLGEGTFCTDADWDYMATITGKSTYANVRGIHEILDYFVNNLDFGGMRVVGPAFESQISAAWYTKPGDNDVGATFGRELATVKNSSYTWHANSQITDWACNIYVGSYAARSRPTGPDAYARDLFSMANDRNRKMRDTTGRSSVWNTEIGLAENWYRIAAQLPSEMERGRYWRAILETMPGIDAYGVCFYRLQNYTVADDAFNGNLDFGVRKANGGWSLGIIPMARYNNQYITNVATHPPFSTFGSYIGASVGTNMTFFGIETVTSS